MDHCIETASGRLDSKTECGRYTIDAIFLNREELVAWREERQQARRDLPVLLRIQEELMARIAENDADTRRKIAALDRFVTRIRAMYGL